MFLLPEKGCDGSRAPRKWGRGLGPIPQGLEANQASHRGTAYLSSMRPGVQPGFFIPQDFSPHLLWVMRKATCASDPLPGKVTILLISWGPSWYLATCQQMHRAALPVQNILHKICFKNNYMSILSWRLATDFLNLVARSQKMVKPQALF